ncbi:MAG TPA: F0F1 ATP synthase subunit A [Kofleriaceae bacterium]|jgi:F-type H+-transporting ATPase subunit a|nr:F0F1 ATP synthase subunit A [Kofleriaceae bacterium]
MGEHGTWIDFLGKFSWWNDLNHWAESKLGRTAGIDMFPSGFTLTHVVITFFVMLFIVWGARAFSKDMRSEGKGVVPPRTMNLRNFFEVLAESVFGMVEGAMGEKNAKRFFPLIGALWFFIFFNNLCALIPGLVAPTDTLKTNVGIALAVFFLTHYYGVKEHGLAYFKHFLGPTPALAPLMLPIELISHVARPLSLAVRLMGNMMADHKVVMSFFALVPFLVPLPFLILGILICLIQALVFSTLATVYIGMAIEHEEH